MNDILDQEAYERVHANLEANKLQAWREERSKARLRGDPVEELTLQQMQDVAQGRLPEEFDISLPEVAEERMAAEPQAEIPEPAGDKARPASIGEVMDLVAELSAQIEKLGEEADDHKIEFDPIIDLAAIAEAIVPDTNSPFPGVHPFTQTLERRPDSPFNDEHVNEWQLNGVDTLENTLSTTYTEYRVPYFQVLNADKDGDLLWAGVDGDLGGLNQGTSRSLWLEAIAGVQTLEMYGFSIGGTLDPLAAADTLVVRQDNDGSGNSVINYVTSATLAVWAAQDIIDEIELLGTLDHGALAGLADDDHLQYLLLAGSKARNAMTGVIGASDESLSIDPDVRGLYNSGENLVLDYDSSQLDGATWTVLDGTILISSDTTVAASGDGAVEITTGGLYAGGGVYADKGGAAAYAGTFVNGSVQGWLGGAQGGRFVDAVGSDARAADGTYDFNAVGNGINSAAGFYATGNQGQTLADGANNLFEDGIFVNDAP
ncbi:MAG: hypothetical protein ACYTEQ_03630, partial [Planctomycetota bacterium]